MRKPSGLLILVCPGSRKFKPKLTNQNVLIMPPTLKKLMGHIAFGACVGACVRAWVGHTFCTYCNF